MAYGHPLDTTLVRLASGDRVPASSGFVQGQLYTDALGDAAVQEGRFPLQPVLAAIAGANDYEGLRAALLKALPDLDADTFAQTMEKALILADLAGRYAVSSDVEG